MNEFLMAEFTRGEVKQTLDNIGDLKAPGADDMPAIFYKYWDLVGESVVQEILHVLQGGIYERDGTIPLWCLSQRSKIQRS